jgi:hypothetical protein
MNWQEREALASAIAKGVRSESDFQAVSHTMIKTVIVTALIAEVIDHLSYQLVLPATYLR